MKHYLAPALALATLCVLAPPSYAHVTANPDNGMADSYFQTSFRISHGCEGSSTKVVRIKIPAEIVTVRAQHKPEWNVEVVKHALPAPISIGHGKTTSEAIDEIIWRGGELPDDQYDEFGLIMKLPNTTGKTLWFPTVQECDDGKNEWVQIPTSVDAWHSVEKPAPFVTIKPAKPSAQNHMHHHGGAK